MGALLHFDIQSGISLYLRKQRLMYRSTSIKEHGVLKYFTTNSSI